MPSARAESLLPSKMSLNALATPRGTLQLPAFMPDATRGVVRGLDSADVESVGIECLMVNSLHLAVSPGTSVIAAQGGMHAFMGWRGVVASDSGGFQAMSLSGAAGKATVTDAGITYRPANGKKQVITPEKCIQRQFELGADIIFCLDECTHPNRPGAEQRSSVERTVMWGRECKEVFERLSARQNATGARPLLFAVVQGGEDLGLRRECAERLAEIGFDGYGFGGWPVRPDGALVDSVHALPEMLPRDVPLHGLGIGSPENVLAAWRCGYRLFDCTLPTRDARHQRLYRFLFDPAELAPNPLERFYDSAHASGEQWTRDARPIDTWCDCVTCRRYSRAYLRHLFQTGDAAAQRLATIHNLRFYTRLTDALRRLDAAPSETSTAT